MAFDSLRFRTIALYDTGPLALLSNDLPALRNFEHNDFQPEQRKKNFNSQWDTSKIFTNSFDSVLKIKYCVAALFVFSFFSSRIFLSFVRNKLNKLAQKKLGETAYQADDRIRIP